MKEQKILKQIKEEIRKRSHEAGLFVLSDSTDYYAGQVTAYEDILGFIRDELEKGRKDEPKR